MSTLEITRASSFVQIAAGVLDVLIVAVNFGTGEYRQIWFLQIRSMG
jgi:hypothetical protein